MSKSGLCNGNVIPSRFLKLDTTAPGGMVAQAGATDVTIGVCQPGTRQAPIVGLDDGYAGVALINVVQYWDTPGEECWLEIGAAVAAGDLLKPSTNGVAITVTSNNDVYGARALENGTASGQLIRCRIEFGYYGV